MQPILILIDQIWNEKKMRVQQHQMDKNKPINQHRPLSRTRLLVWSLPTRKLPALLPPLL